MKPFTQEIPKIPTYDARRKQNGWLLPMYNVHETRIPKRRTPQQVYLTVVNPGAQKGPHLHKQRWGLMICIRGDVKIVLRQKGGYREYFSGEKHGFRLVQIPAGTPAAIYNLGRQEAYVINMPSPAWSRKNPDDFSASFAEYEKRKGRK